MDPVYFPFLSSILGIYALTAAVLAWLPSKGKSDEQIANNCKNISLISSGFVLLIVLAMTIGGFKASGTDLQFVENYKWFGNISSFKLGMDGLSLSMVLLTTLLTPFIILASHNVVKNNKPKLYYSLLFILLISLFGVFTSQDLLFFFLFWELELLPMYLFISIWGGEERLKAANKFLLFTFLGGAFILAGILSIFWIAGGQTFSFLEVSNNLQILQSAKGILSQYKYLLHFVFCLFAIGFCIKLPSIPFHTWLPEAHVQAPAPISMMLAGVLLKMGGYGLIRFGLQFFPQALADFSPYLAVLGAINILGAALFCLVQDDMKKVIAYSSVSHMGFVLLGLAALNTAGIEGIIFQMFSHGIISAGLFMVIGSIYERTHTRKISEMSGLAAKMPQLFFLFLALSMANLGLPALSGFIGESLVFYGVFLSGSSPLIIMSGVVSTIGVILTAGYMLWLLKRLFFGNLSPQWKGVQDIYSGERFILYSLLFGSLLLGVYPAVLNNLIEPYSDSVASIFHR